MPSWSTMPHQNVTNDGGYNPLGAMFYAVPFKHVQKARLADAEDFITKAFPVFLGMVIVELLASILLSERPLYRFKDLLGSVNLGISQQIVVLWTKGTILLAYIYVHENFAVTALAPSWDSWKTYLGLLLGCDLAYYWMHRYSHEYHLLWSAHSVHHSGEDYNLATALRQGMGQNLYSWAFSLPLAFFFPPSCYVGHNALNTLYQFWIHTELVGHLGPLEYVLNTASHHRMHHRPPGNCNYAGVFIIWDRMFGTFVAEDSKQDYYGLAKQYETFDPTWANLEHIHRVVASQGWRGLLGRRWKHKSVFDPMALFAPIRPKGGDSVHQLWQFPRGLLWVATLGSFVSIGPIKYSTQHMALISAMSLVTLKSVGFLCDGFSQGWRFETARQLAIVAFRVGMGRFETPVAGFTVLLDAILMVTAVLWSIVVFTNMGSKAQVSNKAE